jgi:MFS family permease
MTCVALGAMFSLAIFQEPIALDTGWSHIGIASAMTLNFIVMGIGGFVWGAASDRFGPRAVVLVGAALLGLALVLSSRAVTLLQFQLTYGILVGIAASTFFAPMIAATTAWFDEHRGLAVSLVSAGMGMAPMTMAPLAAWLETGYGWRAAMLIVAGVAAALMIPASLLIRRPPALEATQSGIAADDAMPQMTVAQAVRSPQFITLMLANFFCCATHSGPIFHTVSYAVTCGIPMIAAVSIYSVEGLAGMFGRIGFGLAGDRFGAQRVLVLGLLAQAFGVLAYVFVSQLGGFYAVAAVVGFIYAGTMPLYAVIIRENFPLRMMGTIIGGTAMAGSLGMSTGPLLGGLIYDRFDSYALMYIGSWGMGLAAMLILLAFRPFPARQAPQMTAA